MELTDAEFDSLYGPVQPLSFEAVHELLGPVSWWVVGGWALELATGISRPHHDLDVAIPRDQLAAATRQLAGYHLWAAQSGSLTPLARLDPLPDDHEQLWLRKNATSPWLLDLLLQPVLNGDWVFKRDHRIRVPLADALWTTRGIRHLSPELALLHKAHLCRPQDEADLTATLPTLSGDQHQWLRKAVRLAVPDSPWNERLARV